MQPIYLDNAATTKIHPEVLEKMLPFLKESFGNPSSTHSFGRKVRVAIEDAREKIASFINADPSEIYFTSGGTEADNFLIRGIAQTEALESDRKKVITSPAEHKAVLDSAKELEKNGFNVDFLDVNSDSTVNLKSLEAKLDKSTSLVSTMYVNNETGSINDIAKISKLTKTYNSLIHIDAVQTFGKIKIDVKELGLDAISCSAHKIGGPKGVGFAYVKNGTPQSPLLVGGGQERNRRGGTENVIGIIGLAAAAELSHNIMDENFIHVSKLRKQLLEGIKQIDDKGISFFDGDNFSPYILNALINPEHYNTDPESILMYMDINGVAVSSGSACTSGTLKPSHVIVASGKTAEEAMGAIRFSFSPTTKKEEIAGALEIFKKLLGKISRSK